MEIEESTDRQSLMDFVLQKLNIQEEDPLIEMKRTVDKGYSVTSKKSLLRYVYLVVDTT